MYSSIDICGILVQLRNHCFVLLTGVWYYASSEVMLRSISLLCPKGIWYSVRTQWVESPDASFGANERAISVSTQICRIYISNLSTMDHASVET